jgi:hypothetical protein
VPAGLFFDMALSWEVLSVSMRRLALFDNPI